MAEKFYLQRSLFSGIFYIDVLLSWNRVFFQAFVNLWLKNCFALQPGGLILIQYQGKHYKGGFLDRLLNCLDEIATVPFEVKTAQPGMFSRLCRFSFDAWL